jgi:hypothetical protein
MKQNRLLKLTAKKSPRKRLAVIAAAAATLSISCTMLAFAARGRQPIVPAPAAAGGAPVAAVQGGPPQRGPVEVVRFTLYDVGIYPPEAHVDKGNVAIAIEDLSGGESALVIERETGSGRVPAGRVDRIDHHPRGRNDLRMEPGRYQVYMADRPENKAVLIVEP